MLLLLLVMAGGFLVSVLSQLSSHVGSKVNPILLPQRQSTCLTDRAIRPTLQKASSAQLPVGGQQMTQPAP